MTKTLGEGFLVQVRSWRKNRKPNKNNASRPQGTGKEITVSFVKKGGEQKVLCIIRDSTFKHARKKIGPEVQNAGYHLPVGCKINHIGNTFIPLKKAKSLEIVVTELTGPTDFGVKADVFETTVQGDVLKKDTFVRGTFPALRQALVFAPHLSLPENVSINKTGSTVIQL